MNKTTMNFPLPSFLSQPIFIIFQKYLVFKINYLFLFFKASTMFWHFFCNFKTDSFIMIVNQFFKFCGVIDFIGSYCLIHFLSIQCLLPVRKRSIPICNQTISFIFRHISFCIVRIKQMMFAAISYAVFFNLQWQFKLLLPYKKLLKDIVFVGDLTLKGFILCIFT